MAQVLVVPLHVAHVGSHARHCVPPDATVPAGHVATQLVPPSSSGVAEPGVQLEQVNAFGHVAHVAWHGWHAMPSE